MIRLPRAGTDLWCKSTDERDLVCLLEGKISVGAQGHPEVTLDKPLDFYQKPRDGSRSSNTSFLKRN